VKSRLLVLLALVTFSARSQAELSVVPPDQVLPFTKDRHGDIRVDSLLPPLSHIVPVVSPHQNDLFESVVSVKFEAGTLVGHAISKIASFIGYETYWSGRAIDTSSATVLRKQLPSVHQKFNHATIRSILIALVGAGRTVVVDHKLRAISVDFTPTYQNRQDPTT